MRLTDWEEERLLIFSAAELARRHRAAGLLLNAPETVALICDAMLEAARAGASYADVEAAGRAAVAPADVMPGVRELVDEVRLEVLMDDGTRLDRARRSARPAPDASEGGARPGRGRSSPPSRLALSRPRADRALTVRNDSARAVRVSSHYPFERVNAAARVRSGRRRRASASTSRPGDSLRWAPGEERDVTLVRVRRRGRSLSRLSPEERLARYGPSTGDRIRLADTRPLDPRRRGPPGDRRRAALGLREEPPRPDDPVGPGRAVGARRRRHRRGRRRPDDRRRQGRHRDQGRPDRRRRAGGERGDQRRDRARRSGRTPRRSSATA